MIDRHVVVGCLNHVVKFKGVKRLCFASLGWRMHFPCWFFGWILLDLAVHGRIVVGPVE